MSRYQNICIIKRTLESNLAYEELSRYLHERQQVELMSGFVDDLSWLVSTVVKYLGSEDYVELKFQVDVDIQDLALDYNNQARG